MKKPTPKKTFRISVPLTEADKQLIRVHAAKRGELAAAFMRRAALTLLKEEGGR